MKPHRDISNWFITNIRKGKGARSYYTYAELRTKEGDLLIAATLDYIFKRIERELKSH